MKKRIQGIKRYPKLKEPKEKYLLINEIYKSINGEGPLQGYPVVILRLMGCNLRCHYCDTKYAYFEGEKVTFKNLLKKIDSFKVKNVLITGGEPLCQTSVAEFAKILIQKDFKVSLETNGTYPISDFPKEVVKIVDVKTPSSGYENYFFEKNLLSLDEKDCLKFVLSTKKDYIWAKEFLKKKSNIRCEVLFCPVYKKLTLRKLAEWILKDNLYVKVSFQLHKLLWGERRGF